MKKLLFILLSISLTSCFENLDDENVNLENDSLKVATQSESDLSNESLTSNVYQEIINLGYEATQIEDIGQSYLVADDLLFAKNRKYSNISTYQTRSQYLVEDITIGVKIDPNLPYEWKIAAKEAMKSWNQILGSSIFLYETDYYWETSLNPLEYANNPEITISSDLNENLPYYVIAAAEFPTFDNKPGYRIRINLDFQSCYINPLIRKYNMMHEIGHCLGFRHTNQPGGIHIDNTPEMDELSIMNGGTACEPKESFSNYDVIAIKKIYPKIIDKPQNVKAYHDGDETLTVQWNPVSSAIRYNIYNNIKESGKNGWVLYRTTSTNSYERELKSKYVKNYKIMVSAVDSYGNESKMVEASYNY